MRQFKPVFFLLYCNIHWAVMLVSGRELVNDICLGALQIVMGTATIGNTTEATSDVNQVLNQNGCNGAVLHPDAPGLWYRFQGTGSHVWITTCFPNSIATDISVYKGGCGNTPLLCVAGVESPCSNPEKFTFHTEVGTIYYVLVRSFTRGEFQLELSSVTLPANDACSTATPVTIGTSAEGNLSFATSDEDQVANANDCSGSSLQAHQPGLWYSFQGTGGVVWLNTCFPGSTLTSLSVYKGSCGIATLQCFTGINAPCFLREKAAFLTDAGTTYRVLVRYWVGSVDSFRLEISKIERPSNDVCATAAAITVGGSTVTGNLTFATSDVDQVLNGHGCSGYTVQDDIPGVWYKFQGTGGLVWLNTCIPGPTVISFSVYKGSCGATTLQCVAGFGTCYGRNEKQVFQTDLDTTYYVLISYWTGSIGAFQFEISSIVRPSNDVCSGAEPITIGRSVVGNLTFATSDEDQVLNNNGCSGTLVYPDLPGLWYKFQGTGSRVWPFTCFPGSSITSISVFKGSCGSSSLQCVVGVDVPCFNDEKFTFLTDIGSTYYMLVKLWSGEPGSFELVLSSALPALSGNDNFNDGCDLATPLAIGSHILGNTSLATSDEGKVPSDCLAGNPIDQHPGVWYRLNGTGGTVIVNTCSQGSMKAHLSVYKGSCSSSAATLQCVDGSYDPCVLPHFTFKTNFDTKYYLLVRPAYTAFNLPTFDLFLYNESKSSSMPTPQGSPIMAPVPAPITGPTAPKMSPVVAPMAPTPITAPFASPIKAPVIPDAPVAAPKTPMAPPVTSPFTSPVVAPTMPSIPKKCGLFGLRMFCPRTRCGLLGRLLGLCKPKDRVFRVL